MANTLGGYAIGQIAQETLDVLMELLVPLRAFTTDLSADIAESGASVATRIPTQVTTGSLETGYSANVQNVTTTAKTVTLGNNRGYVVGFTDSEWAKSSINLRDIFVRPGSNAIATDMFNDLTALVTAANYGSGTNDLQTTATASFDADIVATVANKMTLKKIPRSPRALLLAPAGYLTLSKDNAIQAAYAYGGSEVIRDNRIPRVHGLDVYETTELSGGSTTCYGFACSPQAMIFAARAPAIPAGYPGEIMNVTDPDTGLTIQVRRWYSADDGKHYLAASSIWGVAVGNGGAGGALVRIMSA